MFYLFYSAIVLFIFTTLFSNNTNDASHISTIRYELYHGPIPKKFLPVLSSLDRQLYLEFPYLYAATDEYEEWYWNALSTFTTRLVIAFHEDEIIGVLVALSVEEEEGHKPVVSQHTAYLPGKALNIATVMVIPNYRKKGVARTMMSVCEQEAIKSGYTDTYLITVVRSNNHPLRPENNVFDPDKIWLSLGYQKTGIYELWLWPTRCGTVQHECVATIDNMVQYWHKKL